MDAGTPRPGPRSEPDHLRRQRLPCGADVDNMLEQVAEGRTTPDNEHQADCLHCQAALTELAHLWAPVHRVADQHVQAPAGLVAGVMHHIERLATNAWYTLHLPDGGAIRVATRVVAAIARSAALRVPGVRVVLGRSSDASNAGAAEAGTRWHLQPHSAVGVLGRTAVVDLALTVTYGQSVTDVAQQVQHRVAQELRRDIGLHEVTVNVTVDDILPPSPPPQP